MTYLAYTLLHHDAKDRIHLTLSILHNRHIKIRRICAFVQLSCSIFAFIFALPGIDERKDMQKNDYLWKGILEDIFDDFLRFMHSDADAIFFFERGITFLDKELNQLFPPEEDKTSVKIVDKLAKLYTCDGREEWVLIPCEVQGEYNPDFPRRMFTYFYRIFDKYGKRISAYAILTEKTKKQGRINIRPNFWARSWNTIITFIKSPGKANPTS